MPAIIPPELILLPRGSPTLRRQCAGLASGGSTMGHVHRPGRGCRRRAPSTRTRRLVQLMTGTMMLPCLTQSWGCIPLLVMKPCLSVLLLGLVACSALSCKGPTPAQAPAAPDPAAKATPGPAAVDDEWKSSYWQRAMAHYKPPAQGDFAPAPLAIPSGDGTRPPSAPMATASSSSAPAPATPSAPKPAALVPEQLPFGTRIPGQPGLVKSPYDAEGRSVDVREFAPGQMARCPYSGKVFRVPPR